MTIDDKKSYFEAKENERKNLKERITKINIMRPISS